MQGLRRAAPALALALVAACGNATPAVSPSAAPSTPSEPPAPTPPPPSPSATADPAWLDLGIDLAPFEGEETVVAAVTAGGPGLVAVGVVDPEAGARPMAWTSTDGETWTAAPLPGVEPDPESTERVVPTDVIAVDGGLLAVGSIDSWIDSCGGSTDFVLAATCTWAFRRAIAWTSSDGAAWDRVPDDEAFADHAFGPLVRFGSRTLSVTAGGTYATDDGRTWTFDADEDPSGRPTAVAVLGEGLVAVGEATDATGSMYPAAWGSADGIAWTRSILAGTLDVFGVAARDGEAVATGADNWSQGLVWRSTDGLTWAKVETVEDSLPVLGRVAATAGGFVGVGPTGVFDTSDGADWRQRVAFAGLGPDVVLRPVDVVHVADATFVFGQPFDEERARQLVPLVGWRGPASVAP